MNPRREVFQFGLVNMQLIGHRQQKRLHHMLAQAGEILFRAILSAAQARQSTLAAIAAIANLERDMMLAEESS